MKLIDRLILDEKVARRKVPLFDYWQKTDFNPDEWEPDPHSRWFLVPKKVGDIHAPA